LTFKDLKKYLSPQDTIITTILQQQQQQQQDVILFEKFKGKPFWIWDKAEHKKLYRKFNGECCSQHILGLPTKYGIERPIFPFQKIIYDTLFKETSSFQDHHCWIKKSSGLGVSEFFLRLLVWLALKDRTYSGSDFCIITAPRIDLSIDNGFIY
jgi:hypothetical protein